ncbi:hypothetical protein BKA64DRAFT_754737 [Cadophora sp. MPI-SDFR-AT-0126]|nr:hypothetical protein BKA64DRAFT_754737 [Leotiomycetes sp. MPI-SDFR-AT-0126]
MATDIDQYWHKRGTFGVLTRATLRTLQFIFAVTIIGIYSPDLTHSTSTHAQAHSEWIFADVAACLSALTCITHCFVTVTRVAWCLWDWVLCVLWLSQVGVFAGIYLKGDPKKEEQYAGATSDVGRMRAGVGIGVVNLMLWFATGLLGFAWCCAARRFTRRAKTLKGQIPGEASADGGRKEVMDDDIEKRASGQPGEQSAAVHAYSSISGERSTEERSEELDLKGGNSGESLLKPPSYKSV